MNAIKRYNVEEEEDDNDDDDEKAVDDDDDDNKIVKEKKKIRLYKPFQVLLEDVTFQLFTNFIDIWLQKNEKKKLA